MFTILDSSNKRRAGEIYEIQNSRKTQNKIAAQTQCKEKSPCVMRFTETMAQIGKVCVSVLDSISLSSSATLALMCQMSQNTHGRVSGTAALSSSLCLNKPNQD